MTFADVQVVAVIVRPIACGLVLLLFNLRWWDVWWQEVRPLALSLGLLFLGLLFLGLLFLGLLLGLLLGLFLALLSSVILQPLAFLNQLSVLGRTCKSWIAVLCKSCKSWIAARGFNGLQRRLVDEGEELDVCSICQAEYAAGEEVSVFTIYFLPPSSS